tara:strand:- start:53 stop:484 length:432 start_codon:yes stop_codon:yes gene_type:complete
MLINLKSGTQTHSPRKNTQEVLKERADIYESDKITQMQSLREYRDQKLSESDWMVVKASESGGSISTAWSNYRQALRDLPSHSRAPNRFLTADWPLSPDETEPSEQVGIFIAETRDPVGLGTTSWVGLSTTGEYILLPKPESE